MLQKKNRPLQHLYQALRQQQVNSIFNLIARVRYVRKYKYAHTTNKNVQMVYDMMGNFINEKMLNVANLNTNTRVIEKESASVTSLSSAKPTPGKFDFSSN